MIHFVITGGAAGIGHFLSNSLIEKGHKVTILDKNNDCKIDSSRVSYYKCDVTDLSGLNNVLDKIVQEQGFPDVVINNAGIIHNELLFNFSNKQMEHSSESWNNVIDVNLTGVFYVTRGFVARLMLERKTAVFINISSISARGNAGQSAYSASKAGVEALTKTWSKELGRLGFRFLAIAPGFMDTDSTKLSLSIESLRKYVDKIPSRKLGNVEAILQSVEFCVFNQYLNGAIINVDGGITI